MYTKRLVFLGKDGHKIVEIGCIAKDNDSTTQFHCLINPEREIPNFATKIHQINNFIVADSPTFQEIAAEFLHFIQDSIIIGHNIKRFDIPFINYELKMINKDPIRNRLDDSMIMYKQRYRGSKARLVDLCNYFEIDLSIRNQYGHNALLDAELAAACYEAMKNNERSLF